MGLEVVDDKKSKTCRAGLYSYNIWSKVREKDKAYTQNGYSSVKLLTIPEMYDTFATASACKWNVPPIDSNVLIDFPESLSVQELLHSTRYLRIYKRAIMNKILTRRFKF
jgi:hypothetical protein